MIYIVVLAAWVALCFFLKQEGEKREIGGNVAFIIGLLFSPLIGFILVALSRPLTSVQSPHTHAYNNDERNSIIANELASLKIKRDEGVITIHEYEVLRAKLLTQQNPLN